MIDGEIRIAVTPEQNHMECTDANKGLPRLFALLPRHHSRPDVSSLFHISGSSTSALLVIGDYIFSLFSCLFVEIIPSMVVLANCVFLSTASHELLPLLLLQLYTAT